MDQHGAAIVVVVALQVINLRVYLMALMPCYIDMNEKATNGLYTETCTHNLYLIIKHAVLLPVHPSSTFFSRPHARTSGFGTFSFADRVEHIFVARLGHRAVIRLGLGQVLAHQTRTWDLPSYPIPSYVDGN